MDGRTIIEGEDCVYESIYFYPLLFKSDLTLEGRMKHVSQLLISNECLLVKKSVLFSVRKEDRHIKFEDWYLHARTDIDLLQSSTSLGCYSMFSIDSLTRIY